MSGPCVVKTGATVFEVFARASDGAIYRRANNGSTWGTWAPLLGLDKNITDVRSDLDCSSTGTTVHIVASGLDPVGAVLHTFGVGTAYNPFKREIESKVFAPSPSIAVGADRYFVGALLEVLPALYPFDEPYFGSELTPITTRNRWLLSSPDTSTTPGFGDGNVFFTAFDEVGTLAIYEWQSNRAGIHWEPPINIPPPTGSFAFSPTICSEDFEYGVSSLNLAAVAGGKLWYARTQYITEPFSAWTMIAEGIASAPDCAVSGPDSVAHVVALSPAGTVLDIHRDGTAWATTDLGIPR